MNTKNFEHLESELVDMHCFASGSLSRIRGIARCALRALESPSGARDLESIAEALQAIAQDADIAHNDIDAAAERCGIKTIDDAWMRRLHAMPKVAAQGGAA